MSNFIFCNQCVATSTTSSLVHCIGFMVRMSMCSSVCCSSHSQLSSYLLLRPYFATISLVVATPVLSLLMMVFHCRCLPDGRNGLSWTGSSNSFAVLRLQSAAWSGRPFDYVAERTNPRRVIRVIIIRFHHT